MFESTLPIAVGILYTICLELLILFFMISFQALPWKFIRDNTRKLARICAVLSFFAGVAGGGLCTVADGYFELEQYLVAMFPALMMIFVIISFFNRDKESKQELVIFTMKSGEYTLDTKVSTIGKSIVPVNLAYYENKIIRFAGAVPTSPVDIKAYCKKEGNVYICTRYEVQEKRERSKREKIELFHSIVLMVVAFCIPLPTTSCFLWFKENGPGENPYMTGIEICLMIVVFGGCRKLFLNGKNTLSKINRFLFSAAYYILIVCAIMNLFI